MGLRDYHVPDFEPVADDDAVVTGPACRFTVLTPRLLRLEYDPEERFEDRPSQLVWFRDRTVPEFDVDRTDGALVIETDRLRLEYEYGDGVDDRAGFAPETLSIELGDGTVWSYGDEDVGLGGALRTLDRIDGATPLEDGLVSRDGWTVLDDTDRLVFGEDGWVRPRGTHPEYEDRYFFGYGHDYRACMRDFTDIAGDVPMLPRWALGNWWSRYWEYTQAELRELLTSFRERGLPLSVCVIDMDWHVVENPHHRGWTGWTWNEEYFPDPEGFVDWLHGEGLRTSLNLHPAEGVHPHEAQYEAFAEDAGIDPASGEPVEFDASDPEILEGYFEHLIHPMEEEDGIDFWWIDWQQWEESPGMAGLDPLWALNHLHTLDRTRDGRRPFILSRWAGIGGHRYQVGFSGDAWITWDSLRFQPALTASSANVAFGWWSHDIGGHTGGTGDPKTFGELYARWTQFGAFSPVNRIHTTKSPSVDKRPWEFDGEIYGALAEALRLRHRLIPYVYTMARRDHTESEPLVRPMYYHHPDVDEAYATPHQYYFGSELVAAPHLRERGDETNLSRRSVWLPEGEWFDLFSGEHYAGDAWHARYGDLDDVPVYAKAGAIVPTAPEVEWVGVENPETLRLVAFPGADNDFELYEDDGVSLDHREGAYATTRFEQTFEGDRLEFEIGPAEGDLGVIPDERDFELHLRGVVEPDAVEIEAGERSREMRYRTEDVTLVVELEGVDVADGATVTVGTGGASLVSRRDRTRRRVEELLHHFEMPVGPKDGLLTEFRTRDRGGEAGDLEWLGEYLQVASTSQRRALLETLTGAGMDLLDHDGDERVVLWNPEGRTDVRFRYTAWDFEGFPSEQSGDARCGTVPEFDRMEFGDESVDATVALNYADLATVTYEDPAADD